MKVTLLLCLMIFGFPVFSFDLYAKCCESFSYEENIDSSNLPVIKISTNGQTILDDPPIIVDFGIIWNGEGVENAFDGALNEYEGKVKVETRGQSSQFFPKKSYSIEMVDEEGEDIDTSFLNFPTEEDWILYAPYTDKTLMRNVLTFHITEEMGQYSVRTRFVELFINEEYKGVYVLMEKIKRDNNRVDIAKLKSEDIEGDELTGGYIFKHDKGEQDWYSEFPAVNDEDSQIGFQYVYPKKSKIAPEQEVYIQNYVDSFEQAIHSSTYYNEAGKRYDEYIDLKSFAETFLINELSKNLDAYRISSYFHKKKDSNGGKIHAGPAWDFNLSFRNGDYCDAANYEDWMYYEYCGNGNPFWWQNMLEDTVFTDVVNCRWQELRAGVLHQDALFAFIDEKVSLLESASVRNFERWDILGEYVWPNPEPIADTYVEEIQQLKVFIGLRLNWMDENMIGNCLVDATTNPDNFLDEQYVKIFPNPANTQLQIDIKQSLPVQIVVTNILGSIVLQKEKKEHNGTLTLDVHHLPTGIYQLSIYVAGERVGGEQLVIDR